MRFQFRFKSDGTMEVIGTPFNGSGAEVFRRSGPYSLEGGRLVSPAVNEGRPVLVRLLNGRLVIKIDDSLVFELQRG